MQKEELFAFAAAQEGAVIDYPFQDDFETAVFRHADTRRWFGIWLSVPCRWFGAEAAGRESAGLFGAEAAGRESAGLFGAKAAGRGNTGLFGADGAGRGSAGAKNTGAAFCLNVKCPPDLTPLLTWQERGVYPAYHMNRTHWVTVRPCECADDTVRRLVQLSYTLTQGKAKARARKK